MSKKKLYRHLCTNESSIPIFSRDWWLDALCGADNWDVSLVEQKGTVMAAMPYFIKHRAFFTLLGQPPLTQTLGPWLRPSNKKYARRLAQEKRILQDLIGQLPPFDYFNQNWHFSQTNWLPFFWNGFSQTTRYTYILPDLTDEKKLWSDLLENIRREIRKALNRFKLRIRDDLDMDSFLALNRLTFSRQGKKLPYSEELVRQLDTACIQHGCRKIFIAEDDKGNHHAGVYIIWDENSAYYLMGGADPELRNSGATSLCMWHAIRHASSVTRRFDFEGSIIEPVERFFRAFGAVQTPYFNITKTNLRLLRLRQCMHGIFRS